MRLIVASMMIAFYFGASAQASEVRLAMLNAPPFQFVDGTSPPCGLVHEVLMAATESTDIRIKVVPCPFARCLRLRKDNQVDVMGGMMLTPERELAFQYLKPAYIHIDTRFKFYSLANAEQVINKYEDLMGKRIGVVRWSVYFPRFDNDKNLTKVSTRSVLHGFDMLVHDRIDVMLAIEQTADQIIGATNIDAQQLSEHGFSFLSGGDGYIVFSDKFSQHSDATAIRHAYLNMYNNGGLDTLLAKYRLSGLSLNAAQREKPCPKIKAAGV